MPYWTAIGETEREQFERERDSEQDPVLRPAVIAMPMRRSPATGPRRSALVRAWPWPLDANTS